MPLILVIGGARSGKSAWAQTRAESQARTPPGRLLMIATAQAFDAEMTQRIERHRLDRGPAWTTLEAPLNLAETLSDLHTEDVAVVDCLTLWLSNLMLAQIDLEPAFAALVAAASASPARIILVTNEVGQGIVPDNALARRFRDEAGRLHQRLAAAADQAVMIVAGLPLWLKGAG
ncbi:MAG: bifunctional adenosylcobinamide kinase/adenosylcobinamide-phosphate guanylyltransferase [Caulobacteraceae bacterium]|nr:bifunctional adenosylcobinamide kinase/adenosylcobinamide-phosphate guanylyltransferase [Caulobacteraceae bacterium]